MITWFHNCFVLIALFFTGGMSYGCPENSGAAGTLYDAVPRSLIVCNNNLSTQTNTLLLEFPNQPLWTNVFIKNKAKVDFPLLWSRVQVSDLICLLCIIMPVHFLICSSDNEMLMHSH